MNGVNNLKIYGDIHLLSLGNARDYCITNELIFDNELNLFSSPVMMI
jgi:hypothetical protein